MKMFCLLLNLSVPLFVRAAPAPDVAKANPTPERPVTDEYHGTKVTDPYRWLENAADPEVVQWTKAEAQKSKTFLEALPHRKEIKAKLQKWNEFKSASYGAVSFREGRFFALKLAPGKNQAILVRLDSLSDFKSEKTILDPNLLDSQGTTAIDDYKASLDGKLVAVTLSKGGSEIGDLHIYQTEDGKELPDSIAIVHRPTAGGSLAWNKKGDGFYYTRYPRQGERPVADLDFYQQVYFHQMGTPEKSDAYSLGKDLPRIAEIQLSTSPDGETILATVENGDGGEYAHYLLGDRKAWKQVTRFEDKATFAQLGAKKDLIFVSLKDSPRGKILRLELASPELAKAKVVVPQGEGVIQSFVPTTNFLYVNAMNGGPTEILAYSLEGETRGKVAAPSLSDSSGLIRTTTDAIAFRTQSFTEPAVWYELANPEAKPVKTALVKKSPVSFADVEVKREFAVSKDGTKIPLNILMKKGTKLNGKNPTLLTGYGGYGISIAPRFSADTHLWLEKGGVYVLANLRGGGEYGEAWHLAGNLNQKQNVFDDFIASAEALIQKKYTDSSHLAIEGGSNGGLLMGAVVTQRPELFRAVVSHVGIYDMARVETDSNGAFNVTEFGSVKDPTQFKTLLAYSPYHNVKEGTAYPAILLLTGANDGRVNPYHSKKMAARFQKASSSKNPVLLRVTFDGGHGIGRSVSQKVDEEADVDAFLFQTLKM